MKTSFLIFVLLFSVSSKTFAMKIQEAPSWSYQLKEVVPAYPSGQNFSDDSRSSNLGRIPDFSKLRHIHISGEIKPGDTKKLSKIIGPRSATLGPYGAPTILISMNSFGGNFSEGLSLSSYLASISAHTLVWKDHKCESSCAIAFLGGMSLSRMGTRMQRYLHNNGTLGFHSPYLAERKIEEFISAPEEKGQISSRYALKVIKSIERANREATKKVLERARRWEITTGFISQFMAVGPENTIKIETFLGALTQNIIVFSDKYTTVDIPTDKHGEETCLLGMQQLIMERCPGCGFMEDGPKSKSYNRIVFEGRAGGGNFYKCILTRRQQNWFIELRDSSDTQIYQNTVTPFMVIGPVGDFTKLSN